MEIEGNKNLLHCRRRLSASTARALASGKEQAAVEKYPSHGAAECSLWPRIGKLPNRMGRKSGARLTTHSGGPSRLDGMDTPPGFGHRTSFGLGRRSRWDLLAAVPGALVAFAIVALIVPPRSGPLALALVLEVHLFIVALAILTPIALLTRARVLGVALLVAIIAGGVLFGSEWVSLPGSAAVRHDLSVMTWNLQYGTRTPGQTAAELETVDVDLIALQELEPQPSAAVDRDPVIAAKYPYRALVPRELASGVAILSRYPIEDVSSSQDPACLELVVETPQGPVRVIDAHPKHADISTLTPLRLPIAYDPSDRDAAIATVRTRIDAAMDDGERLLVLGDYNTASSEPEYAVLTRGLRDTQVQVGEGPGWTWRPSRLTFLPVAFLRIDLQLTAGPIFPTSTSVECSLPGDHCRLFGDYEIDR
jgi:vancomycin resistance protein VanJ